MDCALTKQGLKDLQGAWTGVLMSGQKVIGEGLLTCGSQDDGGDYPFVHGDGKESGVSAAMQTR